MTGPSGRGAGAVDVDAMDALWREDPGEAVRVWEHAMDAKRIRAERDWSVASRPRTRFVPDFDGELWLVAEEGQPGAAAWRVTVHPAPGLAREAEHAVAADVRWYGERLAPPPEADCWFVYDRDCFVEITVPGAEGRPFVLRRSQPSFGRWRIRRRPDPR
jgi:hypothetical protein